MQDTPRPHATSRLAAVALSALLTLAGLSPSSAQDSVRIQFEPGATGTTINGTIVGDDYIDYVLGAQSGQTMVAALDVTGTNGTGSAYFNILPAGQDFPALFTGSSEGRRAEVTLPESGDWAIRVYLMGNDRDTGRTVGYTIDVSIGAGGGAGGGAPGGGAELLPEEDIFVVATSGGPLNVRDAPRPSGALLGQIANGTTLSNAGGCTISDSRQWCNVRDPQIGLTGWVAARFLALPRGGGTSNAPVATGAGSVVEVTGVPADDVLNVRSGPGTGNSITGALGNGSQVRILGCQTVGSARWCEIEMMTDMRERGWVNARFLAGEGAQATQPPGANRSLRVRFESGTTGTEVTDELGPGASVTYQLGARDGQDLHFRLAADSPDLSWRIFNPDGSLLDEAGPGRDDRGQLWRGQLWQSGDHRIEVTNRGPRAQVYNVIFGIQ